MLIIISVAVLVVVFLRFFLQGRVAEGIVIFIRQSFHVDYGTAVRIYDNVIRDNIEIFAIIAIAIFFFILSRYLFKRFAKYFNEINDGIDTLISGEDKEISMSPELDFMEQKLNTLKNTLEKREREAQQAEQRKNDMVMYLAHDIKTPLTSVIGYLSLLEEAPDMPMEQKAKYVHITLEKANRLEKLVDEFFEITRYNFQSGILSKETIDLYYMLVQMADEFYPLLAASGKQVVLHVPEDMAIYGDPDKLARVFNNILKNAIAYSPENNVIDITATISDGKAAIVFTSTGSIPKDKLVSIFDKYYRLDAARSTETGGAGLGLAIAKEIILLHGGSIYADSDEQKTSFTAELPVV
jgi:two-component system sensor histidine kinase VanS